MRKTEVQRPRGFPSRPTRDGNLSRKTLTRSEWWPQRSSNPCSRTAARFCQRINDLRRVESTSTRKGLKSLRRFAGTNRQGYETDRVDDDTGRARREGAIVEAGTTACLRKRH